MPGHSCLLGALWEPARGALRMLQSKKKKETRAFTTDAGPRTPEPASCLCSQIRVPLLPASAEHGLGAVLASPPCPTPRPKPHPCVSEQAGTCLCSSRKGSWQSTCSGFHLKMGARWGCSKGARQSGKNLPKVHCRAQATSAVPRQKGL